MNLKRLCALVTVDSLAHIKDFYGEHFGFLVTTETPGYLHLANQGSELAFMVADKDAPEPFGGKGLTLCLEVGDVDAEAARLTKANIPVVVPLRDNPWCDRSIIFRDPVGIHVYVFQPKP
jgi:predicted enzyme related to lactoylglutathione lyase